MERGATRVQGQGMEKGTFATLVAAWPLGREGVA
jgi:hypothetical protein